MKACALFLEDDVMNGYLSAKSEFLFPDTPLSPLPEALHTAAARNGKAGLQLLFECPEDAGRVEVDAPGFGVEFYQLVKVPVDYNTGNGVDQGGAMVLLPEACPDYAIRKAPFWVLDCLRPLPDGTVLAEDGRCCAYLCLTPGSGMPAGSHTISLIVRAGEQVHRCAVDCRIYDVEFHEEVFGKTNWFSVESIESQHGVRRDEPGFEPLLRSYARAMRRCHQKVFLFWMHEGRPVPKPEKPYRFDFEDLTPMIEVLFEEGFETLETGGLICRGVKPDGSPDMYSADLKCGADPSVSVDSEEGYELLCCEMRDFAAFLRKHGWQDKVLFHVMDEPDVHIRSDADMQARRTQFFLAANIVRRYLPGVRIIEAVKTTLFRGGVDIMVPITDGYEREKASFDAAIALGDEVWTYVCCGPEGKWLNRFLDQPLANGRLLFWGCAANRISGYLHWGFNQFAGVKNPFEKTSCENWTGIGTEFPCGDAFIVYPGTDGCWPSMRLEAERRGAEEAALLWALRQKDEAAHDRLIAKVFRGFEDYDNDPERLEAVFEELLGLLCEGA